MTRTSDLAFQRCVLPTCAATFGIDEVLFSCPACGSLLDVAYDWSRCDVPEAMSFFGDRRGGDGLDTSGVWRFRELLPFAEPDEFVTIGEGRTLFQHANGLAAELGVKPGHLLLQYEGFNPSGSFKDNGMAAAMTMARRLGRTRVACASTGNTSASMAMFAGVAGPRGGRRIEAVVFVGAGKIALGKLAQALDGGARTIQIEGDFDACMRLVRDAADRLGLYLMNSVNPFRIEGQKTIIYRVLEGLTWEAPDWIVVPGGNLGNTSAFGKALSELKELGLIRRMPRLAVINAAGANTFYELWNDVGVRFNGGRIDQSALDAYDARMRSEGRRAKTVASAIEIGRPVNLVKALRSLEATDGVVRQVADREILDAKALVGRHGFGCEPASAASIAGLRAMLAERIVSPDDRVVCILTGHALKDSDVTVRYHTGDGRGGTHERFGNPPVVAEATLDSIERALGESA